MNVRKLGRLRRFARTGPKSVDRAGKKDSNRALGFEVSATVTSFEQQISRHRLFMHKMRMLSGVLATFVSKGYPRTRDSDTALSLPVAAQIACAK
jgi:hypothetical protein